jgi:membrane fusion protein
LVVLPHSAVTPLFRREAVEQQRQQWLGGVRLVRPLSLTLLTAAVVVTAVAVGAWLFFGEYTRKARVAGVIVPDLGLIRLVPPVSGTVVERRVAEGQAVRAGDVLFVIALERTTLDSGSQAKVQASLDERRRSLQEATRQQAALSAAEQDALSRRLRDMKRELDQIDAEAELHRQRVALARQALARLESLRAENFISPAQLQAKSEELLALQTQAQGLERQRAGLMRERATVEGELRSMPMRERGRQGEIERDQATLTREAAEYESARRVQVRAPHDGTVSALAVETGQAVTPSGALASLVPAGAQLQAHLFAPSGAMGFIQPDQAVRLRLQAFPYQKYGALQGRVLQVSRTPLGPNELSSLTAAGPAAGVPGEALFRITVALDADPAAHGWTQPLVPGLRLDADVMLERRRLVEWLFAPVLGLAQRAG